MKGRIIGYLVDSLCVRKIMIGGLLHGRVLRGEKRFAATSASMAPFGTIGSVAGSIFAGYACVTGSYRATFPVFPRLASLPTASLYMIKSERI